MSIAPDAYATIAACQKFDWKHDVCYNTMELQRLSWSPSPGSVSTGPDRLLKEGREEDLWGIKNLTPQKLVTTTVRFRRKTHVFSRV
jgi:hypothetical protein